MRRHSSCLKQELTHWTSTPCLSGWGFFHSGPISRSSEEGVVVVVLFRLLGWPSHLGNWMHTQSCPTLRLPWGLCACLDFCPWNFPSKNTERIAIFFQGSLDHRTAVSPVFPSWAGRFFPLAPPGKYPPPLLTLSCSLQAARPRS